MNFFDWIDNHSFLAFLVICFGSTLIYAAIKVSALVLRGLVRMPAILIRGWPPAHLDADGDWAPAPKETKKPEQTTADTP